MPLLVHGLLGAAEAAEVDTDELTLAAEREIAVIVEGELAAAVSHTDSVEAVPSRANLMAHARVLEHLAEVATVAPMQFGVIVDDHDALASSVEEQHDRVLAVLERLEGHLEFRLRGRYEEDEVIREVVAGDPRAVRLRGKDSFDARMELGERIVAGIEARRDADRGHVLERLGPHVADVAVTEVAEPLDAFSLSLLVGTDHRAAFDEHLEALGSELAPRLRLELVGPVPPFSFADPSES
jgi:hypothetical protein